MKQKDNLDRLEKSKKRIHIKLKDAEKAFKHNIEKVGKVWQANINGVLLSNPDKKALIRDWYTLNGYEVEDA